MKLLSSELRILLTFGEEPFPANFFANEELLSIKFKSVLMEHFLIRSLLA